MFYLFGEWGIGNRIKVALCIFYKADVLSLRYLDEAGFSLTPCVPYCWQEIGEQVTIKSERSKRLNVVGFFNQNTGVRVIYILRVDYQ
ncbi:MAG: hypothetical protein F6K35_36565 [Okeania sp. SIO2H7]|nr:hypothetical protein [Okeania sp. SIO2H7]